MFRRVDRIPEAVRPRSAPAPAADPRFRKIKEEAPKPRVYREEDCARLQKWCEEQVDLTGAESLKHGRQLLLDKFKEEPGKSKGARTVVRKQLSDRIEKSIYDGYAEVNRQKKYLDWRAPGRGEMRTKRARERAAREMSADFLGQVEVWRGESLLKKERDRVEAQFRGQLLERYDDQVKELAAPRRIGETVIRGLARAKGLIGRFFGR